MFLIVINDNLWYVTSLFIFNTDAVRARKATPSLMSNTIFVQNVSNTIPLGAPHR